MRIVHELLPICLVLSKRKPGEVAVIALFVTVAVEKNSQLQIRVEHVGI